jgi:hypothetical protein
MIDDAIATIDFEVKWPPFLGPSVKLKTFRSV